MSLTKQLQTVQITGKYLVLVNLDMKYLVLINTWFSYEIKHVWAFTKEKEYKSNDLDKVQYRPLVSAQNENFPILELKNKTPPIRSTISLRQSAKKMKN